MNPVKHAWFGLVVIGVALLTGCVSPKAGPGAAPVIKAVFMPIIEPPFELACGVNEFLKARGRWPKDYEELSGFLKDSGSRAFAPLQAVQFHSIQFNDLPDGSLRIDADYVFGSGGRARIENMTISAFDPDELKHKP